MLHILHAADLHLDAPFAALTAEQARQRRSEQRLFLDALADTAIEKGADLVLLSGDLLDSEQTYRETAQALAAALGRIPAPVAIAPGNHDFYHPACLYAADFWPKNVILFREPAPQRVELPGLDLYGCAFTGQFRDNSPLAGFQAAGGDKPAVMVCHGDVDGTGRYGSISRQEIAQSGLTYLALGHVHSCSGLQRGGGTYWAYPGCAEGRGFDELGDKGVLSVTIDGEDVSARFVPLAGRRYQLLTVDLTGADSPQEALEEALTPDLERDCLRIRFTGFWPEPLDLNALEALAAPRCFLCALRDETRPVRDLWERTGEESLTGLFLRGLRRKLEDVSDPQERERLTLAARFGLAALEHGEDCCP